MYSKNDNIEVVMGNEMKKSLKASLILFYKDNKKNLEESMRGSEFVFDCVDPLYYKLHKISLNRGGSYIDCFQYAITVALIHKQIKSHPERI